MRNVDLMDMLNCVAASYHINVALVASQEDEHNVFDLGLREFILKKGRPDDGLRNIYASCGPGMIHHILDRYDTEYDVFALPGDYKHYGDYVVIGPYRKEYLDDFHLNRLIQKCGLPMSLLPELRDYYCAVPLVRDWRPWDDLIQSLVRMFYGGEEVLKRFVELKEDDTEEVKEEPWEDTLLLTRLVEKRYQLETELLNAISTGDTDEALKVCRKFSANTMTRRFKDVNRDRRNILIISNTLYRKAAEKGCVHPVHIDRLSAGIAKKIETVCSEAEASRLAQDMVRKYCLLVRNYSLKGYSLVVQKVVNHIDLNLGDNLSLKRLAQEYSVNGSYLSALFKKETGMPITAYTSGQRMKKAILYLNSTDMQIQDVALAVGIPDLNYFSKLFKKTTGLSPTEYRKHLYTSK